jgi:hypothetical protein
MMITTGFAAAAGCIYANKIVEMEREDAVETPSNDDRPIESTYSAHVQALNAKEWHDPLENPDHQPQCNSPSLKKLESSEGRSGSSPPVGEVR